MICITFNLKVDTGKSVLSTCSIRFVPKCIIFDWLCFPDDSDGKKSTCNAGDPGSIPRLGRSPGEGNGHPL